MEFFIVGLVMGIIEDLIAIKVATDATINFRVLWVVFLVAIPFAFLSEIVVDHPRFWEKFFKNSSENKKNDNNLKTP